MKVFKFLFNPQFILFFVLTLGVGTFLSSCESIDNGINTIETYHQISVDIALPLDTIIYESDTIGIDEEEVIL